MDSGQRRLVVLTALLTLSLVPFAPGQAGPALEQARRALAEFKAYARHKNPRVRELAVVTLAGTDHLQVAQALLKMVKDPDAGVRRAAQKGLEQQHSSAAIAELVRIMWRGSDLPQRVAILHAFQKESPKLARGPAQDLSRASDWRLRSAAAELLGFYPDPEGSSLGTLLVLFKDRQPLVRLAAMEAVRRLGNPEAALRTEALLADKDWRVQAAAIKALAGFRQKHSVQTLIEFLRRTRGRLTEDAHKALVAITTTDIPADAERWQKWWDGVKDGYRIPSKAELELRRKKEAQGGYARSPGGRGRYHGIKTPSRRMLFVIDVSSSMADDVVLDESRPGVLERFEKKYGKSRNKIEITRTELIRLVFDLKPYTRFNILTFDAQVHPWQKKLVAATTGNRFKAIKFLDKLTPRKLQAAGSRLRHGKSSAGQTNTYAAINAAFELAREGDQERPRYRTQADTVFFLSDGSPTTGAIVNPDDLLSYVGQLNRKAALVIHTIGFGRDNEAFMRALAFQTGGQYVSIGQ